MDREVKERFDTIHKHYDFYNHLFSFGLDIGWRNAAALESVMPRKRYSVLDIGTGTGDFAIAINRAGIASGREVSITGTDMNVNMLEHARKKIASLSIDGIVLRQGDAFHTRFRDSSFDVVTSAFVMRSLGDRLDEFAKEAYRVTKRGGKVVMVDMALPDKNAAFVKAHFKVINAIGFFAGRKSYSWLTSSITEFDKSHAARVFRDAGFREVRISGLRSGVAFMLTGNK